MKTQFVSFEMAKALKELGFSEKCFAYYMQHPDVGGGPIFLSPETKDYNPHEDFQNHNGRTDLLILRISAPLYQQVVDWFREYHKITIEVFYHKYTKTWECDILFMESSDGKSPDSNKTYYEALNKAIEEALKLI